jgi:hypothetical protein
MRKDIQDVVLAAHPIVPADGPFMDCLAGTVRVPARMAEHSGTLFCDVCGNELGRSGQMRIRVWVDRDQRREAVYAFLNVAEFIRR